MRGGFPPEHFRSGFVALLHCSFWSGHSQASPQEPISDSSALVRHMPGSSSTRKSLLSLGCHRKGTCLPRAASLHPPTARGSSLCLAHRWQLLARSFLSGGEKAQKIPRCPSAETCPKLTSLFGPSTHFASSRAAQEVALRTGSSCHPVPQRHPPHAGAAQPHGPFLGQQVTRWEGDVL